MSNLLFLTFVLVFSLPAAAQPCTKADSECTRWVNLPGNWRSLVYSSYPLDKKNEKINRALIVVHGQGRDADNYFRTALSAAFLADALQNTMVISPRFASNNANCR